MSNQFTGLSRSHVSCRLDFNVAQQRTISLISDGGDCRTMVSYSTATRLGLGAYSILALLTYWLLQADSFWMIGD